ncbi:MAG: hypothetical protein JWP63_6013 [Candidatus Solibacter sp.]|nr:hypothetical protein [Candidatus Solibacter sp.]
MKLWRSAIRRAKTCGVRAALLFLLLASSTLPAQSIVDPSKLRLVLPKFESDDSGLRCDVVPLKPVLNYGFRFQAGYMVTVPMNQFLGPNHGWSMLTRITPVEGDKKPVYLISSATLPNIPKTKVELRFGGGYLLGEGAYDVRWMLLDDTGRACRKSWHVDVHRGHAEQKVRVAMPRETVWELSLRGSRGFPPATDDAAPLRMTIFLHTAPLFPRRTRLRPNDMMTLMSTVASLLERVPVGSVRLVLFNLDQQKELYRKEDFLLQDMAQVSQAMANIELGLVDFQTLQNRRGHVDLMADLVNREIAVQPRSDVVLFLGPAARQFDRMPQSSLEKPAGRLPQFYYFQISPFLRMNAQPVDTIKSTVAKLGGKTILIHNPGEFAKAIERLEKAGKGPA